MEDLDDDVPCRLDDGEQEAQGQDGRQDERGHDCLVQKDPRGGMKGPDMTIIGKEVIDPGNPVPEHNQISL